MPRTSQRQPAQVAIVGAGTLASALARALHSNGYQITEIVSREDPRSLQRARALAKEVAAAATTMERAELSAPIVWICVPDDAIATVADRIVEGRKWREKVAVHSSGALSSDALAALQEKGAEIASAHPLMTFIRSSKAIFGGVPFAIEGTEKAARAVTRIVRNLEASPFQIGKEEKPAYHAFGFFSSPAIVAVITAAQHVGELAGLDAKRARELMEPIVRQTIDNCFRTSPEQAFSGPVRRGDVETVRKHVQVLRPHSELLTLYRALVRIALKDLPSSRTQELQKIVE